MIGHEPEVRRLRSLLAALPRSGGALVVDGDAGIGKSELLEVVAHLAREAGVRRLRSVGVRSESAVPFAALHALLRPMLGSPELRSHHSQLRAALGRGSVQVPDQRGTSLRVLRVLADLAATGPLLVVVEDVQWVDGPSAEVLSSVGRHLGQHPVLLLLSRRTGEGDPRPWSGLPTMRLGPLGEQEARRLLESTPGVLGDAHRAQVLAEAAGNPLALVELSAGLLVRGRTQVARLPAQLPLSERLQEAFSVGVADLPPSSRRLLLLASAGAPLSRDDLVRAGGALATGPDDLLVLQRRGFLEFAEGRVLFRHPLLSSAVYQGALLTERLRVHRVLASIASDADEAAWHRAAAVVGGDESAASGLDLAAFHARGRGAVVVAAQAMRAAALLTPTGPGKVRRLLDAAGAARQAGMVDAAQRMVDAALPLAATPIETSRLLTLEGMIGMTTGMPRRSSSVVLDAALHALGHEEPDHPGSRRAGARLLGLAALVAYVEPHASDAKAEIVRELEARDDAADPRLTVALALASPAGRVDGLHARLAGAEQRARHPHVMMGLALAAEALHDLGGAERFWSAGVDRLTAPHHAVDRSFALAFRGRVRGVSGRLVEGLADLGSALRTATDLGGPVVSALASASAARINIARGDAAAASEALRRSARLSQAVSNALVTADLQWAMGEEALLGRRPREAWVSLGGASAHPTTALWAIGAYAEAASLAGRAEEAREVVQDAERAAASSRSAHLAVLVHHARAVLSTGDLAEEHFAAALAARSPSTVLEVARAQVHHGERLRRERRINEARGHLAEAHEAFTAAGALPWASRAAVELRAAGVVVDRGRAPDGAGGVPRGLLTPQELRIAQLAASGMTNREIAEHIVASPRTVSAHLYHAFPKLGVTSRGQLSAVLPAAPGAEEPPPGRHPVT